MSGVVAVLATLVTEGTMEALSVLTSTSSAGAQRDPCPPGRSHQRPINNHRSDKGVGMSGLLELLRDNTSVLGRLVTTAVLLVVALLV
ncbi:MAG: hypothetical protein M3332_04315, partial [Actinomycetota bacterium]|nr:hypothetical protein [Actinomycetota bacterium]